MDNKNFQKNYEKAMAATKPYSNSQYELNEMSRATDTLRAVEKAPLADRKEAQAVYLKDIQSDPEHVAEKVGWLLDGNYGHGEMLKAKQILGSPRSNRVAGLSQMVAVYDYKCPASFAVAAWKKLSQPQKDKLQAKIQAVIKDAENEE